MKEITIGPMVKIHYWCPGKLTTNFNLQKGYFVYHQFIHHYLIPYISTFKKLIRSSFQGQSLHSYLQVVEQDIQSFN